MPGVTVRLDDAGVDGTFGTADDVPAVATRVTGAGGLDLFDNRRPGVSRVRVDPATLPNGITEPTFDLDGIGSPHQAALTLSSGQALLDTGFGYSPPLVPPLPGATGQLGDRVWYDSNANGLDDNEPGIQGVTVRVYWFGFDGLEGTADDLQPFQAVTDGNGNYGLDCLPLGNSRVTADKSTISSAATETDHLDSGTTNPDGTTVAVLTAARPAEDGADFGYFVLPAFGDRIWLDLNGDGVQDPGEPGLAGVTVTAE
jgi:hypothetical protein